MLLENQTEIGFDGKLNGIPRELKAAVTDVAAETTRARAESAVCGYGPGSTANPFVPQGYQLFRIPHMGARASNAFVHHQSRGLFQILRLYAFNRIVSLR